MANIINITISDETPTISVEVLDLSLPPGGFTGQALVKTSNNDFAVEWSSVVIGEGAPAIFNNITELLASDVRTWSTARTLNSYGIDAIYTSWERFLNAHPNYPDFTPNGDSILVDNAGRGVMVRTAVIPLV